MRSPSIWLTRLILALVLMGSIGGSLVSAQDATPEASPVSGESPEASPVASPVAEAEATCSPGASITSAEQIAIEEERFEIEQPENTEGTYVSGTIGDLQSVNPYIVEEETSLTVVGYIFDSLLGGDSQTGQPVPGGVTDYWELAEDCVTYTFHLRQDKVWHDGTDLTSADVAFSFESLADESLASPYTGSFLDAVASWEVIDADTINVVSNGARADFLNNAGFFIIAKHIWESVPRDQWVDDPGSTGQDPSRVVGTGAFTFDSWTQGQEIVLARNDAYTPRPVWISSVVLRIYSDSEAQLNAFLTGEIDDIGLEPEQVSAVEADPEQFTVATYPDRSFTYYGFNLTSESARFQDVRVRQAFNFAIDRQSIVDNILLGYGEVANGTQPSISFAYAPDQMNTTFEYDPATAVALLTEAGWVDTNGNGVVDKDGVEMEFELLYASGSSTVDTLVAYLQDAWSQVGIAITPVGLEFGALIEAITTNRDFEMVLIGFGWDSTFIQDVMFGCDQWYPIGFNDQQYCNPDLDVLGEQIKVTLDQDERAALMIDYSNVVNDEQPVGMINFQVSIVAWNNRVHNFYQNAWGGLGVQYIWIAE